MVFRLTFFKAITLLLVFVLVTIFIVIVSASILVTSSTEEKLYSNINSIPHNKVGLLLGTSKISRSGGINDHYRLRLSAAYELISARRIDYILISGDNSTPYYDEPTTIRNDLLKMGIPASKIYRDYAGYRTIDSITRAKTVFNLSEFTIISQEYLNYRALYIALNHKINAIAFNAGTGMNSDFNNRGREILARVLAILELHLIYTEPEHTELEVHIGSTPPT